MVSWGDEHLDSFAVSHKCRCAVCPCDSRVFNTSSDLCALCRRGEHASITDDVRTREFINERLK